MKTMLGAACAAALAIAMASPAAASLVQYQYDGVVVAVFGPEPTGVVAGDAAHVRLVFDTANLVDVSALASAETGVDYTDLKAASLSAPGAQLQIFVGPNAFTQADHFDFFGDSFGFGEPYVLFNNGAFFGIEYFGLNAYGAGLATAGAAPEMFDFAGGGFRPEGPSYAGYFDYAKAIRTDVPEPAVWSLMIVGFGMMGAALRRQQRRYA